MASPAESSGDSTVFAAAPATPEAVRPEAPLDTIDVGMYEGVYGSAKRPNRDFFVTEAAPAQGQDITYPEGHLHIGAMWGDVAPWTVAPQSATRFVQQSVSDFQPAPLVAEFELGDDGRAVAVTFTGMFEDRGRLERTGDLPEGW